MKTKYIQFFEIQQNSLDQLTDVALVDKFVQFIKNNPFPQDHEQLHKFANDHNVEPNIVEQYAYAMLTLLLAGGKSKGMITNTNIEQLEIGEKIESEHIEYSGINNPVIKKMQTIISQKIAYDHLAENKEYYTTPTDFKAELEKEKK